MASAIALTDESGFDWSGTSCDPSRLLNLTEFLLRKLGMHPECEVSIALVTPEVMTDLHVTWMDEEGPTDVLSFPMDNLHPGTDAAQPPLGILGDVIMCPRVALEQAELAGHDLTTELDILMTHGVLHLLGFDHATQDEHTRMFSLQDQLLAHWPTVEHVEGL